jgi:hypothetical protein
MRKPSSVQSPLLQQVRLAFKRYPGEWLAVHPETYKVLSHHRSRDRAKLVAEKSGVPHPQLMQVPKGSRFFVGAS